MLHPNQQSMISFDTLSPHELWKFFLHLCSIPRPSKKEGQVAAYVASVGKELQLDTRIDKVGNVLIRKPATQGLEKSQGVILQAHLDMVPQKNNDKLFDFEKDPIEPLLEGEWMTANGTTLGADNGIGVAAMLAIMTSTDIAHPALELLFTVDEETGMTGAFGLEPGILQGKILLNLDTEDDGELCIGCAGGINNTGRIDFEKTPPPPHSSAYRISVKGLLGGHSGMDINLGRGNANKILNRLLLQMSKQMEFHLADFTGGSLRNAIPREAEATIAIPDTETQLLMNLVRTYLSLIQSEYQEAEPHVEILITPAPLPQFVADITSRNKLLHVIAALPDGPLRMVHQMPDVVETSTNLAVVRTEPTHFEILNLTRSAVDTSKQYLSQRIESLYNLAGGSVQHDGEYPGWHPRTDSSILSLMKDTYNKLRGKEASIKITHGGLECGIIGSIYPNLEMISFGPTIRYPHSPDEKVNIKSVQHFGEYLLEVLKGIPASLNHR